MFYCTFFFHVVYDATFFVEATLISGHSYVFLKASSPCLWAYLDMFIKMRIRLRYVPLRQFIGLQILKLDYACDLKKKKKYYATQN